MLHLKLLRRKLKVTDFSTDEPTLVVPNYLKRAEKTNDIFYSISGVLKTYGQQLKAPAAMVRLRLCETLLLLSPHSYESKTRTSEFVETNGVINFAF